MMENGETWNLHAVCLASLLRLFISDLIHYAPSVLASQLMIIVKQ